MSMFFLLWLYNRKTNSIGVLFTIYSTYTIFYLTQPGKRIAAVSSSRLHCLASHLTCRRLSFSSTQYKTYTCLVLVHRIERFIYQRVACGARWALHKAQQADGKAEDLFFAQ